MLLIVIIICFSALHLGLPLFYVTKDRLLPRFKSHLIRKSWLFFDAVNERLRRLHESGIQINWSEGMLHKYRLMGLLYPNDYVDVNKLTKLDILKMLSYILTLDIIACAYFVLEILCKKLELRLARRNVNLFFWSKWTNMDM